MLQRFSAATAIAAIAIACGASAILWIPANTARNLFPVTLAWCFVPLIWGFWALLTPAAWVPDRFPAWGALLGFIAAFFAIFVVNIPARVFGASMSGIGIRTHFTTWTRALAMVVVAVVYYFLWMLVRVAYRSFAPMASRAQTATGQSGR